jgi:hypothetical protein
MISLFRAGEGEGEGEIAAYHPHLKSSPSKRRARKLWEATAHSMFARKIFGVESLHSRILLNPQ